MHQIAETLDDALRELYPRLLYSDLRVPASRGDSRELIGVSLEITRPRARLSRTETRGKPFSAIGELLWYLSRDNSLDFIRYYIPAYVKEAEDSETVYGGYGPRLFRQRGYDQIASVVTLLKARPTTRRAVIQLFNAEDIAEDHIEVPCTTTLQFMIRAGCLHMITTMRSNDAYKGLPHDVFCFTVLQEIIARVLGVELGTYRHFAGSMHLYDADAADAERYISEDFQPRIEMPEMPLGDPWPAIRNVLDAEDRIRAGETFDAGARGLDPYWADLVRLLQILHATGDQERINAIKSQMTFRRYGAYIEPRKAMKPRPEHEPRQPSFRFWKTSP